MTELILESRIHDVLFREVHHRFYNSLQIISASARLLTGHEVTVDMVSAFQHRIVALGNLHRLMFEPLGHDGSATATIKRICDNLAAAFGRLDASFHFALGELPAAPLAARTVLLAVAELVTNAFKHSNPSSPLRIAICAEHVEHDFLLRVASNTLPAKGLRPIRPHIVDEMVQAVGGDMTVRCGPEFLVEIRLPQVGKVF